MTAGGVPLTRRSLVIGSVGLLLAGCSPEAPADGHPRPATSTPAPFATPEPEPTPEPDPVLETPPRPDVEAVIAAHEGLAPTRWGIHFPGVVRTGVDAGSAQPGAVHLTLDACGGPTGSGYDAALIDGLVQAGIPATLFLNLRWITANPDLAAQLAANPLFTIQNHGAVHRPLSVTGAAAYGIAGTASAREAAYEVWENHLAIENLAGVAPRWFRPGTAHLDDVGLSIAASLGEGIAGFAVNGDGGATLPAAAVTGELLRCTGGEIVIAHMNQPGSGTAAGILQAIPQLLDRGLSFAAL